MAKKKTARRKVQSTSVLASIQGNVKKMQQEAEAVFTPGAPSGMATLSAETGESASSNLQQRTEGDAWSVQQYY